MYLKCLLVSLCTLMKTINFHHILTNISNLFRQFINTHQTCMFKKFLIFFLPRVNSSQGQCSLKFIGPKIWSEIPDHIKFRSHFISNICTKITYSLGFVQINEWNLLNSSCFVHSLWFVWRDFFHHDHVFCYIFFTNHVYILIMCTSSCVLLYILYLQTL